MYDTQLLNEMLIFSAIKRNDYVSYNKLFVCYYGKLCQYVYSILENKEDAEDIVQELFLIIWNNREKIDVKENVSAYLYRMAKNLSLNHLKGNVNRHLPLESSEGVCEYEDNKIESDEFHIALFDCIDRLPPRSRQVLLLHKLKGIRQKEIAAQLNISVKTIKNQIWTSLQKLKRCLQLKEINY